MNRIIRLSTVLFVSMICFCQAADEAKTDEEKKEVTKEELMSPENVKRISETYGHLIYKSLNNPTLQLGADNVIQGIQDARDGKRSPMSDQEYEEAIANIQEFAFKEMSEKNLQAANDFLAKNATAEGVVELEPGKLQVLIQQEGEGEEVTDETLPTLHYTGKYIDGTVFGSSDKEHPSSINLKHTIPGFRQGIVGMKVGEKRTIFIHPDLGYGTAGQLLPNALLIFEIEVVSVEPLPQEKEEVASLEDEASDDEMDMDDDESDDDNDEGDEEDSE